MRKKESSLIKVDFANKKVESKQTFVYEIKETEYDFSNFMEISPESPHFGISDKDRYQMSEAILDKIDNISFANLVAYANQGVLDLKKVDDRLAIGITDSPPPFPTPPQYPYDPA